MTSLKAKADKEKLSNQLLSLMEMVKTHSTLLQPSLQNKVPFNNDSCESNTCYTSSIVTPMAHTNIKFGENSI